MLGFPFFPTIFLWQGQPVSLHSGNRNLTPYLRPNICSISPMALFLMASITLPFLLLNYFLRTTHPSFILPLEYSST